MGQSSHSLDGGGGEELPQDCQDFTFLLNEAKEVSENASKVPLQAALMGFLPPELLWVEFAEPEIGTAWSC